MTRRRCFFGVLVASLGAVAGTGSSAGSAPFQPSCAAVTTTLAHPDQGAQGPKLYNLAFRVRCNFRLTRLRLEASRSLVRILPNPVLEHPDQGDTLTCQRRASKVARCLGDVGERVRIVGELKVRGRPCARPLPRFRFRAFGGEDCDEPGTACPDIGYSAGKRVTHPRGCG
jgi:hypothetical protein